MVPQIVIRENWFTLPPKKSAAPLTLFITIFLFFAGLYFFQNTFSAQTWMPASRDSAINHHEFWRLWTSLFAHADFGHLINNALLFIPLTYLLLAYFPFWFFPVLSLAQGGLINYIVLQTMPSSVQLIGISGVVYWMGGAWLTLFLLIDRRKNLKYRFANVLFLMLMIFIPETYSPQISYLSHSIGFLLGSGSATILYVWQRPLFLKAEVKDVIYDEVLEDFLFEDSPDDENHIFH